VGHGEIVVKALGQHVEDPTVIGLPHVEARLGQHNAIEIRVSSFQALLQAIAAERTEHAEDVGLGVFIRLVASQDADREDARSIHDLLGGISAEIADDLAACALLPLLGVMVPVMIPSLERLYHPVPSQYF